MSVSVKRYSAILILLMYLIAEIGFGMHCCHIENTSHISPSLTITTCESSHGHQPSNHHHHSENRACSSCQSNNTLTDSTDGHFSSQDHCNNEFFSLNIDQLTSNVRSELDQLLIHLKFDNLLNSTISIYAIKVRHNTYNLPLRLNLRKILTLLSNWRL